VRSRWLFWGLFVGFLAIDQVVKFLARANFHEHETYPLWPGVFELTLTYNKGIAFGTLQGLGVYLSPVAILIAGGAAYYSFRNPKESAWIHAAMGLLASGAIGNLYDRIALGRVTDMFWIRAIDFPVFNIADACISVAAGILVIKWGMESFKKPAAEAAKIDPEPEPVSSSGPGL
jgi:signal peptidase II